jgi:hypothetical protein
MMSNQLFFKKLVLVGIACAVLLAASLTGGSRGAHAAVIDVKYSAQADALNKLQLFQGTERGYELDQTFTRAQGATMLLRLFGWETAAANAPGLTSPFTDVPPGHWAGKAVAFAYEKALVHGVSSDQFAPDASMTGAQFIALTLRALGYADAEPQQASEQAVSSGLLSATDAKQFVQAAVFSRDDMVAVAYSAIQTKLKGSERSLLQKLVEDDKAVRAEAAADSGLYKKPAAGDSMDQIEAAIKDALKH